MNKPNDEVREALERLLKSVHPYPEPNPDFDPFTAPNKDFGPLGLPERPDAETQPEYWEFWKKLFSPPQDGQLDIQPPDLPEVGEIDIPLVEDRGDPGRRNGFGAIRRFNHTQNSRNWSGAYITPVPRPNRFTQVVGAWQVPTVQIPDTLPSSAEDQKPETNDDFKASTWIGLGGQRRYNSLPQIGTTIELNKGTGKTEVSVWWQWWIEGRRGHHIPIPIRNVPGGTGDDILACVFVDAPGPDKCWPGDARFIIKHQRTGRLVVFKVCAPADIVPLGSTAEWIHERPAKSNVLFPLPKFTDVEFRHCLAWNAPLGCDLPMVQQGLESNARYVRMVEIFNQRRRSALVSMPEKTQPTELKIGYSGP